MISRSSRLLFSSTVLAVAGALAVPTVALAAPTSDTVTTFEVNAGTLDILAPATSDLLGGAPGTDITGQLGAVTVTDGRASADASWDATVTSTDFTTGGGTPAETVLASQVDYWSGPATATTGTGTFTPGENNAAAAAALDNTTSLASFTHGAGTGDDTATWDPTIVVHVPLASETGTYTGTVTHSVA